jgi:hypothetical protein
MSENNGTNSKFTILMGNIVQNEVNTVKRMDLKNEITKIVENIKVKIIEI